jgi:hypothetical protein
MERRQKPGAKTRRGRQVHHLQHTAQLARQSLWRARVELRALPTARQGLVLPQPLRRDWLRALAIRRNSDRRLFMARTTRIAGIKLPVLPHRGQSDGGRAPQFAVRSFCRSFPS